MRKIFDVLRLSYCRSYILFAFILLVFSSESQALVCRDNRTGDTFGPGTMDIFVRLPAKIEDSTFVQVIDLSQYISCANEDDTQQSADFVNLRRDSGFVPPLSEKVRGRADFYTWIGQPLPLRQDTTNLRIWQYGVWVPIPAKFYFHIKGGESGEIIKGGSLVAKLIMHKESTIPGAEFTWDWNIYSLNPVHVDNVCNVSSPHSDVTLPPYPGGPVAIPLSISCRSPKHVRYSLSGTTVDNGKIFMNTASATPASGVGIQISDRSGPLVAGNKVDLGRTSNTLPVELGLKASYATINGEKLGAGKVQSIINVTFEYD
ncbi:fimbrial protein [Raoultella planticola]|uniref:fimbrial protein n=1 Tax=Raoultella planticola TaxID=575 RepID=UPI00090773CD|nr:fimbrial protein [Raoultella planticola]